MKKVMTMIWLALATFQINAQQARYITNPVYYEPRLNSDSIKYISEAAEQLRKLKEGVLIVKLPTAAESIETYKKAGLNDVADKIAYENNLLNQKIFDAFERYFSFCKVSYVYANDAKALSENKKGILLNAALKYDPTAELSDNNFLFCELKGNTDEVSSLIITDKSGMMLHGPFPAKIILENNNYEEAIKLLDQQLELTYYNMVIDKTTGQNTSPNTQQLVTKKQPF